MIPIPETTKRRLERQYHPAQNLDGREHSEAECTRTLDQLAIPQSRRSPPPAEEVQRRGSRTLPTRAVTDESLDDAYVAFIMYCNPIIPPETDVIELKKTFRAPPKSDGKTFSTFILFELIRKLEMKEIKTWAQLAIDLGVEPPALEKRQSAQKVQQYAVRLKRWMHAMHVDAFFEYLLSKPHVYWTKVPSIHEPPSDLGRDGVTAEEDLALRALLPETKPKRGRRKAEDKDNDSDTGRSPAQRPRLDSPTLSEDFMIARASLIADNTTTPATAHPDFLRQSFHDRVAPWSANPMTDSFRWGAADSTQTPISAYPQSAVTPTNRDQLWNDVTNEPRSAITPKSRVRRRHGPAVSSAWPSNGSASSGKLRGRPPSNRNVTDGPFSTFPANPVPKDVTLINNTPAATPIVGNAEGQQFFPPSMKNIPTTPPVQNGRPSGLQLQVPRREGGAVRLATPPPVVLLNGETNTSMSTTGIATSNIQQNLQPGLQHDPLSYPPQSTSLMEYFGNSVEPDPSFQHFVSIAFRQNEDTDRTNVAALESHFIAEILGAEWYDASGLSIERCSIDEADKICKQVIKNLQAESSSTEAFLINLSALAGGPLMTRLRMTRLEYGSRADYECHWKMRFGSIEGDFTIRATVQQDVDSAESARAMGQRPEDRAETWKKRYLDLQQQIRERDERVGQLKRGLLDALVESNHWTHI